MQRAKHGHGRPALTPPRRAVSTPAFSDIEILRPFIQFRHALDPRKIFLPNALFFEGRAQRPVHLFIQGEEHHPARFHVQPVVEGRIRAGAALFFKIAQERGKEVVAGVRGGLLAGYPGFLVVGEKEAVAEKDARGVDFVEFADAVRGKAVPIFLSPPQAFLPGCARYGPPRRPSRINQGRASSSSGTLSQADTTVSSARPPSSPPVRHLKEEPKPGLDCRIRASSHLCCGTVSRPCHGSCQKSS